MHIRWLDKLRLGLTIRFGKNKGLKLHGGGDEKISCKRGKSGQVIRPWISFAGTKKIKKFE